MWHNPRLITEMDALLLLVLKTPGYEMHAINIIVDWVYKG
jgi:hypothetical protein